MIEMGASNYNQRFHLLPGSKVWRRCTPDAEGRCSSNPESPSLTRSGIAKRGGGLVVVRDLRRVSPMNEDGFFWTAPLDGSEGRRRYWDKHERPLSRGERVRLHRDLSKDEDQE